MSLETVTAGLREKVGSDCGLGASVKFDFGDDGCLFLDATESPNVVNNDNADAQCTMIISIENFMEMASGELDGTAAFMSGKLRIEGVFTTVAREHGVVEKSARPLPDQYSDTLNVIAIGVR